MQHGLDQPMLCIDEKNAIYVTPKELHGPRVPIHIIKSLLLGKLYCESEICRDMAKIAARSGHPGTECHHLQRTNSAQRYIPPPPLNTTSLDQMLNKGLMSKLRVEESKDLLLKACEEEVDCVFPIFWGEYGLAQTYIYFSVFTNLKDNWCQLGRTIVTFDTHSGKWHCPCRGSKPRLSCVHRCVCMWWVFQEHPSWLKDNSIASPEEIEDIEENEEDRDDDRKPSNETASAVIKMTEYLMRCKKIPETLPQESTVREMVIPQSFVPKETKCPYCPGPCYPNLSDAILKTKCGTIYGLFSVHKGVAVYIKECPVCGTQVRFQEYNSGFHNFNNKVFLTIPLCSLLTTGLSNHIAVGRFLRTLGEHSKVYIPQNTIRKAFYHFSALRSYTYNYFCYRCGHHPPILIADSNWKVAFDLPVHLMRRPDLTNTTSQDTQVNISARWETLEKEIIATGFCDGSSQNPFSSPLTYSAFTPWIGQNSRMSDVIPKTEIFKGLSQKDRLWTKRPIEEFDEDRILQVLETKGPRREDLTKACNALGISASGSQSDLINRLEELLLYKEIYPKMFVKLHKAGGGVLHLGCPHSVVYYQSPLWWQESARDHGDALLSFKFPPTVFISDIAGRVARHVNNRTHQKFFQPYDGRLCAPTAENISAALEKKLEVQHEWVNTLQSSMGPKIHKDKSTDRFTCPHPLTGTCERYSLYDRFHEKKQKRPEKRLRSIKLLPDLASVVNSASAEQINKELSTSRYFLCQLKDIHYMFALRLNFHLHNQRINNNFLQDIQKMSNKDVHLGQHGNLLIGVDEETDKEMYRRTAVKSLTEPQAEPDKVEEDLESFTVSLFPISEQNKAKLKQLYIAWRREREIIHRFSAYATLYIADLRSVCPSSLLDEDQTKNMPWLNDNAVNCRLAQIAAETQNVFALYTDVYILWYREWSQKNAITRSHVQGPKNVQKFLLPRIVGGNTPELGNHFILWVFDVPAKQVRIYDSMRIYNSIERNDMEILREAFQKYGSLEGWTVCNPEQWIQQDCVNCGVFVCTAAEMEAKNMKMSSEVLQTCQLTHLRVYHATSMLKDVTTEDFPTAIGETEESEIETNTCMAQDIKACVYQKTGKKTLHPHTTLMQWVQCDQCNKWLHTDCAGIDPVTISKETPFSCGCDQEQPYSFESTLTALKDGLLVDTVLTDEEIVKLHHDLMSGAVKSQRMFLNKNPNYAPKLKMLCNLRISVFNQEQTEGIIDKVYQVLKWQKTDLSSPSYAMEVMTPEITILILKKTEGFHRFQAEMAFAAAHCVE
ncbi:uncharacterized protein [Chanodichthys erythropterus]|uniref:uncharacterized protein isoform X2 n=1 Tax=Chanodichthys erythropterus TaxID=933992 RepID=UPI00351E3492